jgi:Alcohol dehydrogenase, class IV
VAYLGDGLPSVFDGDGYDPTALDRVVAGVILAQYGVSRPDGSTLNVLHAFGHALRDVFGLQQGVAHAVVAPHALRALFDAGVDPTPVAEGFGVPADAVVDRVVTIREKLDLPGTIRAATDRTDSADAAADDIATAAREATRDSFADNAPPKFGFDATAARGILRAAW